MNEIEKIKYNHCIRFSSDTFSEETLVILSKIVVKINEIIKHLNENNNPSTKK